MEKLDDPSPVKVTTRLDTLCYAPLKSSAPVMTSPEQAAHRAVVHALWDRYMRQHGGTDERERTYAHYLVAKNSYVRIYGED
jgi:hypothetical protein